MIRLTSLDGWREATFEGPEGVYRFHLGQQLHERNQRSLLVIGLNPSTATHLETDPTIRKLEKLARAMAFDRLDMTNLHPLRSTEPVGLLEHRRATSWPNATERRAEAEATNLHVIRWMAARAETVLCAWGGPYSPRAMQDLVAGLARRVVSALVADGRTLHCLALTKDGYPRHPLYLKDELRPAPWGGAA